PCAEKLRAQGLERERRARELAEAERRALAGTDGYVPPMIVYPSSGPTRSRSSTRTPSGSRFPPASSLSPSPSASLSTTRSSGSSGDLDRLTLPSVVTLGQQAPRLVYR
ncbi:hypothetical protein KIPB_013499, partial [Kipferlia bialata]